MAGDLSHQNNNAMVVCVFSRCALYYYVFFKAIFSVFLECVFPFPSRSSAKIVGRNTPSKR